MLVDSLLVGKSGIIWDNTRVNCKHLAFCFLVDILSNIVLLVPFGFCDASYISTGVSFCFTFKSQLLGCGLFWMAHKGHTHQGSTSGPFSDNYRLVLREQIVEPSQPFFLKPPTNLKIDTHTHIYIYIIYQHILHDNCS